MYESFGSTEPWKLPAIHAVSPAGTLIELHTREWRIKKAAECELQSAALACHLCTSPSEASGEVGRSEATSGRGPSMFVHGSKAARGAQPALPRSSLRSFDPSRAYDWEGRDPPDRREHKRNAGLIPVNRFSTVRHPLLRCLFGSFPCHLRLLGGPLSLHHCLLFCNFRCDHRSIEQESNANQQGEQHCRQDLPRSCTSVV